VLEGCERLAHLGMGNHWQSAPLAIGPTKPRPYTARGRSSEHLGSFFAGTHFRSCAGSPLRVVANGSGCARAVPQPCPFPSTPTHPRPKSAAVRPWNHSSALREWTTVAPGPVLRIPFGTPNRFSAPADARNSLNARQTNRGSNSFAPRERDSLREKHRLEPQLPFERGLLL
jgi:hypothetical protein